MKSLKWQLFFNEILQHLFLTEYIAEESCIKKTKNILRHAA